VGRYVAEQGAVFSQRHHQQGTDAVFNGCTPDRVGLIRERCEVGDMNYAFTREHSSVEATRRERLSQHFSDMLRHCMGRDRAKITVLINR